jgi:predicted thioesterase
MDCRPGLSGKADLIVDESCTADAWGSGLLPVLSTPRVIALMEQAACAALADAMEEGKTTVGTRIDMQHTAATPMGMRVYAKAELVAVEGRALTFHIEAFDEAGSIGSAEHQRFIVETARFMQKVEAKAK